MTSATNRRNLTQRGFEVISADGHFTEPADLWVRYIEPKFRDRAPHVEHREKTDVFVCETTQLLPIGPMHGVRYGGGDVPEDGRYADIPRSGWDPDARIAEIEEDGIYGEVLYATVPMRFFGITDVAFGQACFRAYNTWAGAFGKVRPARFKCIGLSMLDDISAAVAELHRMKGLGLAGSMIAVDGDEAKPYYDAHYDPFWAAAEELELPISLHVGTERILKRYRDAAEKFFRYTAVQKAIVGMIYAGTFDKFPGLQVVSAENDAGWAGNLIERMDYAQTRRARNRYAADRSNRELPSHYWHTNVSCTFMRDMTAIAARQVIGVDRIMWASDFPHGDSTWPESQRVIDAHMQGVPLEEQKMILHDNVQRLYRF